MRILLNTSIDEYPSLTNKTLNTNRPVYKMAAYTVPPAAGVEYGRIETLSMLTVFTPPTSCSSSWTYEPSQANQVSGGLLVQNAASSDGADPSCFPPGWNHFGRKTVNQVYSPGYCPVGYTSASVGVVEPITTAICCLSYVNRHICETETDIHEP